MGAGVKSVSRSRKGRPMTTLITSPQNTEEMGSAVGQVVEEEHPGVAQAREQGQNIARRAARLQAVHEEAQHPQQHHRAGDEVQLPGPPVPEHHGEQDDEDGGGELQDNGVGGGGQLVGHGEQGVGAADAHRPHQDPPVEPGRVPGRPEDTADDQQGHQVPPAVDGQAVPGDDLDAQPPDAVQQGGGKDAQRPRPPGYPQRKTPPVPKDRGRLDAVPPLFAALSQRRPQRVNDSRAVPGAPVLPYSASAVQGAAPGGIPHRSSPPFTGRGLSGQEWGGYSSRSPH